MGKGFNIKAKGNAAAEVYIYEDVGQGWFGGVGAKDFAKELKALGKVEQIDVRINSYGGDVFDGLAIYRQLVDHRAKVTTYIDGIAASIASVIAMAGDEIVVAESGFVMVHNAWGVAMGGPEDMETMAGLLRTTSASIRDVYIARTGSTDAAVSAWMDAETWFTGAEAVEHGFANRMSENMKAAAHLDPAKHKFRNVPAPLFGTPHIDAANERLAAMRSKLAAIKAA